MVKEWQIDRNTYELEMDALKKLLGPKTKLVCFMHCSNVLGTIMPVKEIVQMVGHISRISQTLLLIIYVSR